MEKYLTPNLIQEFRELMNVQDFGYNQFSNVNGKDVWGLICSQMDWIEAWVSEIENIDVNAKPANRSSINIAQFILGIDIIVSATKMLLDYFKIDTKEQMQGNHIFSKHNHFLYLTDYNYFLRIRSSCAVHPNNIEDRKNGRYYYASWISNNITALDTFTIHIYSDNPDDASAESLEVSKAELINFALNWYQKINLLNIKVKKDLTMYLDGLEIED